MQSIYDSVLQVQSWSLDIMQALEHLHGLKPIVMHRDLKPANILVTRDRRSLKLTDFGLAKRFPRFRPSITSEIHDSCDRLSCFIGTPRYAAPELLEHLQPRDIDTHRITYTEKADIYSAALILWYLLTGWQPRCDLRKSPHARPDIRMAQRRWGDAAGLLERMWDHDPAARPAAAECAAALRAMPTPRVGCASGGACALQ